MRTSDRGSASPDRSAVQAPSADRRRVFSAHDESAARAADCAADQTNRDDGCSPAAAATPVECPQVPAPALRRYASARLRNEDRPRHREPKTRTTRGGSVLRPAPSAGDTAGGEEEKGGVI